jgi:hypothetical protein
MCHTYAVGETNANVSIVKNGKNQAIRLPVDMTYEGVEEFEICRKGDVITYMLDAFNSSFIIREHPASVIQRWTAEIKQSRRIVISSITYAEMRYGQIGIKASAKYKTLVDEFVKRLDAVLT